MSWLSKQIKSIGNTKIGDPLHGLKAGLSAFKVFSPSMMAFDSYKGFKNDGLSGFLEAGPENMNDALEDNWPAILAAITAGGGLGGLGAGASGATGAEAAPILTAGSEGAGAIGGLGGASTVLPEVVVTGTSGAGVLGGLGVAGGAGAAASQLGSASPSSSTPQLPEVVVQGSNPGYINGLDVLGGLGGTPVATLPTVTVESTNPNYTDGLDVLGGLGAITSVPPGYQAPQPQVETDQQRYGTIENVNRILQGISVAGSLAGAGDTSGAPPSPTSSSPGAAIEIPYYGRDFNPYADNYYTYGSRGEHKYFNNRAAPQAPPPNLDVQTPGPPLGYADGGSCGIMEYADGGSPGEYIQGPGSGRSDDIPARLSDGEYVFDAESVALLGDGSGAAGADKLDNMRKSIRVHKGRSLSKGKISPNAYVDAMQYVDGGR